jgi:hypothetical protein
MPWRGLTCSLFAAAAAGCAHGDAAHATTGPSVAPASWPALRDLRGEMTITFTLADANGGGTDLDAMHEGLPPGVPALDNETGWRLALDKLSRRSCRCAGSDPDRGWRGGGVLQATRCALRDSSCCFRFSSQ